MRRSAVAAMPRLVVAAALAAGCDRGPAPLADCGGDLRGIWHVSETGARWQVAIGRGGRWELYPLVDERPPVPAGTVAAPAFFAFERAPAGATELTGTLTRRFERGAALCPVQTLARLHGCHGDRAVLEVAAPQPPSDFTTCSAPTGPPAAWTLTR